MDDTPLAGQGACCTSSAEIQHRTTVFVLFSPILHQRAKMLCASVSKGAEPAAKSSQREPSAASPQPCVGIPAKQQKHARGAPTVKG